MNYLGKIKTPTKEHRRAYVLGRSTPKYMRKVFLAPSEVHLSESSQDIARVRRIANSFDLDKYEEKGAPKVLLYGGRYYVYDGHHRLLALEQLGLSDEKVPMILYDIDAAYKDIRYK